MSRYTEIEARITELQTQLADIEAQQNARPNLHNLPDGEWQAELEARKPLVRKRAELSKAIAAQEAALKLWAWDLAPMPPVKFLVSLRDAIVNGPEPPKRPPKWRFKVADDFALQLQARDKTRILFEGVALEGEGITGDSFRENRSEHSRLRQMKFEIRPHGELWALKPGYSYTCVTGLFGEERERASIRVIAELKERIAEALSSIFEDGQIPLIEDFCLICGRRLTDAVSRSRHIGPECWGDSSNLAPLHIGRLLTDEEVTA